ncbi:MAG: protein phosphatase 2C domain-containing protein, partial [Endozoicomonadaceae bacterium]|nr:protein phosphatase 2C domain-containing protein [Endozoicomonadaceae bacterium]
MIEFAIFSHAGKTGDNQDCVLAERHHDECLLVIADGMGGKEAGGEAAKIAAAVLGSMFKNDKAYDLPAMIRYAKEKITVFAEENSIKQMGTTLTACLINKGKVTVAHIGDTRLYHLRNEGIISVTKDQTEVQKLIDDGKIKKKRAQHYHRRNILLSA